MYLWLSDAALGVSPKVTDRPPVRPGKERVAGGRPYRHLWLQGRPLPLSPLDDGGPVKAVGRPPERSGAGLTGQCRLTH